MSKLLTTEQMAEFTASGCLFFDSLIPDEINKEFLTDIGHTDVDKIDSSRDTTVLLKLYEPYV